jgi:DNA helicase-2/ATP-dependent DNA helicase PcrA
VAGAGAGKTKTITHRIIHLIHQGINPENILAVTFTNKAAKEMKQRVFDLLEEREQGNKTTVDNFGNFKNTPYVSTFHSLGVKIIKDNSSVIDLPKHFSILDEDDSLSIIKEIMKRHDIDPKTQEPRKIRSIISKNKGDFVSSEAYAGVAQSYFQKMVALIWGDYENELKKEKALDFDDLLIKATNILKENENIRLFYQQKWQYLHVDEYQDTNQVQYEMARLLTGQNKNICVVGDTDQNIYSWRGANIKNMFLFEKDYPEAKVVTLEQNYRSTKNILAVANKIIEKNIYRVPKNLFTENQSGEKINLCEAYDEQTEADYIAQKIEDLIHGGSDPKEIAVLYRANFQSRVIEEYLLKKGVPYQVLGVKFFDRKEVKDILAYLRASLNKESLSDIKRTINNPARGIGKTTIAKLFSGQTKEIPPKTMIKVNDFYKILDDIETFCLNHKPSEIIKYIMGRSGIKESLIGGASDDLEKLENIKELVTLATKYDGEEEGLEKLIEDASLFSEQDSLAQKDVGVRLMTVHAAKGLEFKNVFISGLEQGLFPYSKDGEDGKEDKEEERRLFYVAITRAKEKLFLSYATIRTIFGSKQVNSPSEFIYDIPSELVDFEQSFYSKRGKVVYLD